VSESESELFIYNPRRKSVYLSLSETAVTYKGKKLKAISVCLNSDVGSTEKWRM
jgi:hypothetical protein